MSTKHLLPPPVLLLEVGDRARGALGGRRGGLHGDGAQRPGCFEVWGDVCQFRFGPDGSAKGRAARTRPTRMEHDACMRPWGPPLFSPALRRAATGPVGRAMKAAELVRAMAATRPRRAVLRFRVAAPSMLLRLCSCLESAAAAAECGLLAC